MEGTLRRSPAVRYSFIRSRFEVVLRSHRWEEIFRRIWEHLRNDDRSLRFDPKKDNLSRRGIETSGSFIEDSINWATGEARYGSKERKPVVSGRRNWNFIAQRTIGYCMLQWRFHVSGEIRAVLYSLPNYRDGTWFDSPRAWRVRFWVDVQVLWY